jgi:hypothetical protein
MPHRQTIDFLRRRYAAAILCEDADTASRLRAELDGIMNHRASSVGEVPEAPRAAPSPGQPWPMLHLVPPVTGLVEGFGRRRRA